MIIQTPRHETGANQLFVSVNGWNLCLLHDYLDIGPNEIQLLDFPLSLGPKLDITISNGKETTHSSYVTGSIEKIYVGTFITL